MAPGKKRGKGEGGETGWVGDGDGDGDVLDHHFATAPLLPLLPYVLRTVLGADQETAKGGARAPTRTLNLATLMRSQGRWYSTLVQSPPFNLSCLSAPSPVTAANLAGAGLPELWGCVSRNEVPLCCGWPSGAPTGGVARTTHPCPAENTSHFPTSQANQLIKTDHHQPNTEPPSRAHAFLRLLLLYVHQPHCRMQSVLLCSYLRGV